MSKKGSPDVVYIQGVGEGIGEFGPDFMGDDDFNTLLDMIDAKYNITGTTENNIVKIIDCKIKHLYQYYRQQTTPTNN